MSLTVDPGMEWELCPDRGPRCELLTTGSVCRSRSGHSTALLRVAADEEPLADWERELLGGCDPVQTPEHYRWIPGVECIDVAQHFGYCLGNVIKYVWRADHKGKPIQDLEKALTYLQLELERRKAES